MFSGGDIEVVTLAIRRMRNALDLIENGGKLVTDGRLSDSISDAPTLTESGPQEEMGAKGQLPGGNEVGNVRPRRLKWLLKFSCF